MSVRTPEVDSLLVQAGCRGLLRSLAFCCLACLGLVACGGGSDASSPLSRDSAEAHRAFSSARMVPLQATSAAAQPPVTPEVLLNWVESKLPDLFPVYGSNRYDAVQVEGVEYYARQYAGPAGFRYLAVAKSGSVVGFGDFTGNKLQGYGVIDDWSPSVQADRCTFDRHACAQGLLGRRWQVPKLISPSFSYFALDDLGNATAAYLAPVGSSIGLFAVHGTFNSADNSLSWSNSKRIDVAGGQALATPLSSNTNADRFATLAVAPGGDVVAVFIGTGACTPNTFNGNPRICYHHYAARYSSKQRVWGDALKFAEAPQPFQSTLAVNDRGDLAILGVAAIKDGTSSNKSVMAMYLSTAAERGFRRVIVDNASLGSGSSSNHALSMDDNGAILYVVSQEVAGSSTLLTYSGTVAAGLGSAVSIPEAKGRYLGMTVGRAGQQSIVLDLKQIAVRKSPKDPFQILSTGSDGIGNFRGVVLSDVGEVMLFEAHFSGPRYHVFNLPTGQRSTFKLPGLFPFGDNDQIAINRKGDIAALMSNGNCGNGAAFGYNRATDEMTFPMGWMGASSTVTGKVACPQTLYRFGEIRLSLNGVALVSMSNEYVTMPTATSAGTSNSSANNFWLSHLK